MQKTTLPRIFCIAGTRPEYIKLFPVYKKLLEKNAFDLKWVSSGQHPDLVEDLESFFDIKPDYRFDLSEVKIATLTKRAAKILEIAGSLFEKEKPDLIIVQGDTISAQQVGLAAFYQNIPVAHIEAGLRTCNIKAPFPEEFARRSLAQICDYNFAPTQKAYENLEREKILFQNKGQNFLVGNTVVDALNYVVNRTCAGNFIWDHRGISLHAFTFKKIDLNVYLKKQTKYILITAHRRENSRETVASLVKAILKLSCERPGLDFVISVHKNPDARNELEELYKFALEKNLKNIIFLDSVNYPLFVKLMKESFFIVTDSGGIQEEAPYLLKPVLVLRNETERVEGITHGVAKLIGTQEDAIYQSMQELLDSDSLRNSMIDHDANLYGDGKSSERIIDELYKQLLPQSLLLSQ